MLWELSSVLRPLTLSFYCKLNIFFFAIEESHNNAFELQHSNDIYHFSANFTNEHNVIYLIMKIYVLFIFSVIEILDYKIYFYDYFTKKFYAIVCWCNQHVLWLNLDGIKYTTRNLSSKVTPSDIIRESFFSSFFNRLGTICTMWIWAWKWGSVVM